VSTSSSRSLSAAALARILPAYLAIVLLYINIFALPPITVALMAETGIGHFQAGLLMTVYTVVYCLGNIFTGILSDRFGPSRVMFGGLVAGFLGALLFTFTRGYSVMLASRVCLGLAAAAMTSPCLVYLYGWLPPERRALGVSGQLASLTLGAALAFLLTPLLITALPWRVLLRFYALTGMAVLVIFRLVTRDPPGEREKTAGPEKRIGEVFRNPALLLLSGVLFISLFQISGTMTWLAPWLEEKCGLTPLRIGLGAAAFSLIGIPSTLVGGALATRFGPGGVRKTVRLSMIGMLVSASTGAFIFLEKPGMFPLVLAVIILARWGSFMSVGPLLALVPRLVRPELAGKAAGLVNSVAMSGGFAASLLAGLAIEKTGQYHLVWLGFAGALLASAIGLHPLLARALSVSGAAGKTEKTGGAI